MPLFWGAPDLRKKTGPLQDGSELISLIHEKKALAHRPSCIASCLRSLGKYPDEFLSFRAVV